MIYRSLDRFLIAEEFELNLIIYVFTYVVYRIHMRGFGSLKRFDFLLNCVHAKYSNTYKCAKIKSP